MSVSTINAFFLRSLLIAVSLAAIQAHAAVLVVNSTADDGSPGTLRWAISQHASLGGSNEISFDASLAGQTIVPTSNLPPINGGTLIINGGDAPGLAVTGSPPGRIFMINNGGTTVEFNDIELRLSDGAFGGGCIRASGGMSLIFRRVRMAGCTQHQFNTSNVEGGAIRADLTGGGSLRVFDSEFVANGVSGAANLVFGGAIWVEGADLVQIEGSRFELNTSEDISNGFNLGGAVYVSNSVQVFIEENEFLFNQAPGSAGGALALNLRPSDQAFVRDNLFAGNVADNGAAVWTGTQTAGSSPFIEFTHNTFLANRSNSNFGGALFFREGQLMLRLNSWVDNVNDGGGAANLAYNPTNTQITSMWNNLFGPATTPSCAVTSGTPASPNGGYNLRPDGSCNFNGFSDVVGPAGPFLPLGHYGGPTRTVPPASGNLALDNGNPAVPGSSTNASVCLADDARGAPRPGDGDADGNPLCDIGAFEWGHEAPLFLDGLEDGALVIP